MDGGWDVYFGHSLQIMVGAVLLMAGVPKLRQPRSFMAAVRGYDIVPPGLVAPVAIVVMGSEVLIGLALLFGLGVAVAAPAAGGLFAAFAVAVGINLRRGAAVPCGCFGAADERISPLTLARLGLLFAATTALVVVRVGSAGMPLDVAELVAGGRAGVEHLVTTSAFAAFLGVMGIWLLRVREVVPIIGGIRPHRPSRERT